MSEEDQAVERKAAELLTRLDDEADWEAARRRPGRAATTSSATEMSEFLDRNEAPAGPLQEADDDDSTLRLMHKDDRSRGERRWRYPEWDDDLGDYKPDWVGVIEFHLDAGETAFVDDVLAEHGHMIQRLRRTFEAMRPEHMRPKRGLNDGDTLDMDAVIAARVARRAGVSGPAGLYRARRPAERDVSVAFLVDMSSSTNEHINTAGKRITDVEREALVVTAEAVDALGDRMAIYGYSGFGREAVASTWPRSEEPYGPTVRQRIGRMGLEAGESRRRSHSSRSPSTRAGAQHDADTDPVVRRQALGRRLRGLQRRLCTDGHPDGARRGTEGGGTPILHHRRSERPRLPAPDLRRPWLHHHRLSR